MSTAPRLCSTYTPNIALFLRARLYLVLLICLLTGCSAAERSFNKAEHLEEAGNYEDAMYRYAEAFRQKPGTSLYRLGFLRTREKAAHAKFESGKHLLIQKEYVRALQAFQEATVLDPTQQSYQDAAKQTALWASAEQRYKEGLDFLKTSKPILAQKAFSDAVKQHPEEVVYQDALHQFIQQPTDQFNNHELLLTSANPLNLRFRGGRLKDLFQQVGRLSGINFVFDEGVKDQTISTPMEKMHFQRVLDLLASMFKLDYGIINNATVLVYPQTTEKTKQYQSLQLRTYPLTYLDAKKAANLVRSMLQVKRIYINEDANALVVRDTKEVTDVIAKMLEAQDVPEAEVVLDVEVIEVSDKNTHSLGLLLSNYNVQLGAFSPSGNLLATTLKDTTAASSTTTTTTATIDNLVRAFSINRFGGYVTVPNAQYNFGKTLANGEVLSNPKIRVKNKEKAKFNVGTRVPITTTTMATTGSTSQVNVQYVDVGVKVNAEPTIQLNNEVSIKLSLEVSSILSRETVGGKDSATTVVTIGTRNLDTVLSLKDGETSVIGGLISKNKSDSKQKIFLLGDIPLLGPLLSSSEASNDKTELILAITPRLVRGVTVQPASVSSFDSGKEDEPSLVPPYAAFEESAEYQALPSTPLASAPLPTSSQGSVPAAQPQKETDTAKPTAIDTTKPVDLRQTAPLAASPPTALQQQGITPPDQGLVTPNDGGPIHLQPNTQSGSSSSPAKEKP